MKKKIAALLVLSLALTLLFTACTPSPQKQILGKWADSVGTRSFEFKEEGKVHLTFYRFLLPETGRFRILDSLISLVNQGLTGEADGSYTIDKETSKLTITYTIYSKTIRDEYTFAFQDGNLVLTDTEDGKASTYFPQTADTTTTAP